MNLSERLKIHAEVDRKFQVVSTEGTPNPADDLDLAADIIDSLPKAQDGSVIWKGCWAVIDFQADHGVIDSILATISYAADDDVVFDWVMPGHTHEGWECSASEVRSTHRTREEAEAAAAKAGGNNQ